jgi:hypothetical protein
MLSIQVRPMKGPLHYFKLMLPGIYRTIKPPLFAGDSEIYEWACGCTVESEDETVAEGTLCHQHVGLFAEPKDAMFKPRLFAKLDDRRRSIREE